MKRTLSVIAAVGILSAAVALISGAFGPFSPRSVELTLPGVVEIQEVRLGSKVGGRVSEVLVVEGETVEVGHKLVAFDIPEIEARRRQAEARLRGAEEAWKKAKNGPRLEEIAAARGLLEAATARRDRIQSGPREEEKRQALGEFENAEAAQNLASIEMERVARLFRQNSVARSEFDTSKAALERYQALTEAARAKLDLLRAGSRPEEIAEAAAETRRARADLDLLLAGARAEDIAAAEAAVAEARASLDEIEANVKEAVVLAPSKAVIEVVSVREGDVVPPNSPIIRALRAEDLWIKVYVPETDLGKVRLNDKVSVTVDSYPGTRFDGLVSQIAGISEFTPRNIQSIDERRHQVFAVKVLVVDPKGVFKSGMSAEVSIPLREPR